ncbi:MAG: hypothetical protein NW214_12635 [Pseudanabaenaceae cyanobacterium bins.39]|nr:hypothetical protein [Pseudanabaenaceae cyanobacterium bins.39]
MTIKKPAGGILAGRNYVDTSLVNLLSSLGEWRLVIAVTGIERSFA